MLSGILRSVRVEGAVYLQAEFSAPWCIRGPYGADRAVKNFAGMQHIVHFLCIVEGDCHLRLLDEPGVVEATAGDVILFTRDDRHLMGSDLAPAPLETSAPADPSVDGTADTVHPRRGAGGAPTRVISGYFACSKGMCRLLLQALPRMLHVRIGAGATASLISELLSMAVRESNELRPGADGVLVKVGELLFAEALRRHTETMPRGSAPWLSRLTQQGFAVRGLRA